MRSIEENRGQWGVMANGYKASFGDNLFKCIKIGCGHGHMAVNVLKISSNYALETGEELHGVSVASR